MNTIFSNFIDKEILVFINNWVIYSHGSKQKHTNSIVQVLEKCNQCRLVSKVTKYKFYKRHKDFSILLLVDIL